MNSTPQDIAKRCAQKMWDNDCASRAMGMQLIEVLPGSATLIMKVADTMINGLNVCHGGHLFTLADSCFAFSCNTYNIQVLAMGCSIDYLAPAKTGQTVKAIGTERRRNKTTGIYDVTLTVEEETIALFRGKSYALKDRAIL